MRDELVQLLKAEPFVPFKIVLSSGEGFTVTNAQMVALGESMMHVFFARSDRYAILRLNQVVSIEVLEPAG